MKTENLKRLAALALSALCLSALSLSLSREAPASEVAPGAAAAPASATASATATATATASASASASASAPEEGAEANLSIADWVPPEGESDKPTPEEWQNATKLSFLRPRKNCIASAVREWLRLSFKDEAEFIRGVRVMSGSEKDVSIVDYTWKGPKREWEMGPAVRDHYGFHLIFPVRKGDRRVLGVVNWESGGFKSWYIVEDTVDVISALWLPNEAKPTIVLH